MTAAALRCEGLVKRFGPVTALRGVDLELPSGRSLCVLGRNGAGKSTLLRLLAGLARPSEGRILRDGQLRKGPAARRDVGVVAHASMLYAELGARENLEFAGRLHGVPDPAARAMALLEEDGLADVADRRVGGLSRGMTQRVAIARALVHDPALVLLDEPFTGLDRRSADRLAARLGRLREEGRSLLVVTHEAPQVAAIADAAVVLERGRVVHQAEGALLATERLEPALLAAAESRP